MLGTLFLNWENAIYCCIAGLVVLVITCLYFFGLMIYNLFACQSNKLPAPFDICTKFGDFNAKVFLGGLLLSLILLII